MILIMAVLVLLWFGCGLLGAGWDFAHVQSTCPELTPELAEEFRREELGFALLLGIFGPFAMIVALFRSGFGKHGWRLW